MLILIDRHILKGNTYTVLYRTRRTVVIEEDVGSFSHFVRADSVGDTAQNVASDTAQRDSHRRSRRRAHSVATGTGRAASQAGVQVQPHAQIELPKCSVILKRMTD